ncbi:hypothetical protein IW261DRAFT_1427643 [Armillaria novae-zelandiae]|uniref:MYND-type domain-containing protein n=1 Tax=Armillaria novae-zelandiae TaxID=153914 RepID=A0AA39ND96_9AGAR|nr:hypothetical protein IW261DRAFT_1427643 [Armillaria novae-zelandiae]
MAKQSSPNTPSQKHSIFHILHDSTRKIHRLSHPSSSADLEHNIRIVVELSSQVTLRKILQLSEDHLPLKALQDFLWVIQPWVEEAFRTYIIKPTHANREAVFDHISYPTDSEGGSVLAVICAAPNESVFKAPVCLCWLGAILKTFVREVDCRAVKEVITWTLGCLAHVLPFSHYTVIGNLVQSGLLKDVMTAAAKMTRTDVAMEFSTKQSWLLLKDATTILGAIYERRRKCTTTPQKWQYCSECGIAVYCSRKFQKEDWTVGHRGLCIESQKVSLKGVHTKDFMFNESIIGAKILWYWHKVDNKRKDFINAGNGQYDENDSILVFDYSCSFNTSIEFHWKKAEEEDWNDVDSYKVEIMARGRGKEYLWHTTYPKVVD